MSAGTVDVTICRNCEIDPAEPTGYCGYCEAALLPVPNRQEPRFDQELGAVIASAIDEIVVAHRAAVDTPSLQSLDRFAQTLVRQGVRVRDVGRARQAALSENFR